VQIFRWTYMIEAYSESSRKHAQALLDDAACRPLSRYPPTGRGAARAALEHHGLLDAFLAASHPQDNVALLAAPLPRRAPRQR
jgi:hypothetical protein